MQSSYSCVRLKSTEKSGETTEKQTASKRKKPMLYRRQLKSKFIISGSDYNNNTQIIQNKYSENSDKK